MVVVVPPDGLAPNCSRPHRYAQSVNKKPLFRYIHFHLLRRESSKKIQSVEWSI